MTKTVHIPMTEEEWDKLKIIAINKKTSLVELIRELLTKEIKKGSK